MWGAWADGFCDYLPSSSRSFIPGGADNMVADALSRMFEGQTFESPEMICANLLNSLPLVYYSLYEHHKDDVFCQDLRKKVEGKEASGKNFQIYKDLLCYFPRSAKRRRWVVPPCLRSMVIRYFHDGILAGHLGAPKILGKICSNL